MVILLAKMRKWREKKNDDDKERTNVKLVVKNKIKYHVKI